MQGWLLTVSFAALAVTLLVVLRDSSARVPLVVVLFAVYAMVALATGGRSRDDTVMPGLTVPEEALPRAGGIGDEQREALRSLTGGREAVVAHDGPALVVEHLTKRFGERVAVEDVSFTVAAGEVFGFLGPNGAGKTTTVRMLAAVIAPTSGHQCGWRVSPSSRPTGCWSGSG